MAYINTHLIVKPESNWLSAGTINKRINTHPQNIKTHNLVSYFSQKVTQKITTPLTTTLIAPKFQFYIIPYKDIQKHILPT